VRHARASSGVPPWFGLARPGRHHGAACGEAMGSQTKPGHDTKEVGRDTDEDGEDARTAVAETSR
jgi:hypothetical protein